MRKRLDLLLLDLGLFDSRAKARAAIEAGGVTVDGRMVGKPSQAVDEDAKIAAVAAHPYVGRGALKLEHALSLWPIPVEGRMVLDVGASTGGFTDCLLQRGAAHVTALDVAYGELDWRIRNDRRVTIVERTNARRLTPADLPGAPDLIVADVSFISLRKVLPAVLACIAARFDLLALVKPQFELERGRVGKGGVVREAEDRRAALVSVAALLRDLGHAVLGFASSGLPGPAGNRETFVWAAEGDRAGAVADLEAAAREVEP